MNMNAVTKMKRVLIRHNANDLEFRQDLHVIRGERIDVVTGLERLGYTPREIANAICSLELNRHNWAEFDASKSFLYSGSYQH